MVRMKGRNLQIGDSGSVGCGLNEIHTHCSTCQGMAWTVKENPIALPFYASPGCLIWCITPERSSSACAAHDSLSQNWCLRVLWNRL